MAIGTKTVLWGFYILSSCIFVYTFYGILCVLLWNKYSCHIRQLWWYKIWSFTLFLRFTLPDSRLRLFNITLKKRKQLSKFAETVKCIRFHKQSISLYNKVLSPLKEIENTLIRICELYYIYRHLYTTHFRKKKNQKNSTLSF